MENSLCHHKCNGPHITQVLQREAQGLKEQDLCWGWKEDPSPQGWEWRKRGETPSAAGCMGCHTQPWRCSSRLARKIGCRCVEPHSVSQAHSARCWWVDCQRGGHPLTDTMSIAQPVPCIHCPPRGISVSGFREKGPACLPVFVTGAQRGEQNCEARQYF